MSKRELSLFPQFHFSQSTSQLFIPQILHNNCFQFFLGITIIQIECENNGNAKYRGRKGLGAGVGG